MCAAVWGEWGREGGEGCGGEWEEGEGVVDLGEHVGLGYKGSSESFCMTRLLLCDQWEDSVRRQVLASGADCRGGSVS